MKKRFFAVLLAVLFVFHVPVCYATDVRVQTQEGQIKAAVEEYLSRYANVVYSFEDDDLRIGTVAGVDDETVCSNGRTDEAEVTFAAKASKFAEYANIKADYFKRYHQEHGIIRENCRYEYDYHQISVDNSIATVRVSEFAYFNYEDDPIDSVLESVFNLTLSKKSGNWLISDVFEENWFDAEFSAMDIQEIKTAVALLDRTEELQTAEELSTPDDPEIEITSTSANQRIYYNKANASAYAMTYTTSNSSASATSFYNSNFSDWTSYGDCQNFASQCVWAGFYGNNDSTAIYSYAVPMDTVGGSDTLTWYGSSVQWNETSTWRGCDMFRNYVIASSSDSGVGLYGDVYDISANSGISGVSYSTLVGAVIQVDGYVNGQSAAYNHSVVVDSATGLSRDEIYCCAHTSMAKHVKLSDLSQSKAKLIIPRYFRTENSTANLIRGTLMNPVQQGSSATISSYTMDTQYKMTMRIFTPSGTSVYQTVYNSAEINYLYTFSEKGLYRIVTYAKVNSENDTASSHQFYIRVY